MKIENLFARYIPSEPSAEFESMHSPRNTEIIHAMNILYAKAIAREIAYGIPPGRFRKGA